MTQRATESSLAAGPSVWFLPPGMTVVGRYDERMPVPPDVDLTELDPDRSVSRRHAELEVTASAVVLRDLGSANGTWLGETAVGPDGTALIDACSLRFGDVWVHFRPASVAARPEIQQSEPVADPTRTRMRADRPAGAAPAGQPVMHGRWGRLRGALRRH
ncbi:MAG TPA: FHA domain-containing protein [Mycobacteriales bacterium]|nr:FHA domain-containing protein [Mycobacteriales bacterium]